MQILMMPNIQYNLIQLVQLFMISIMVQTVHVFLAKDWICLELLIAHQLPANIIVDSKT